MEEETKLSVTKLANESTSVAENNASVIASEDNTSVADIEGGKSVTNGEENTSVRVPKEEKSITAEEDNKNVAAWEDKKNMVAREDKESAIAEQEKENVVAGEQKESIAADKANLPESNWSLADQLWNKIYVTLALGSAFFIHTFTEIWSGIQDSLKIIRRKGEGFFRETYTEIRSGIQDPRKMIRKIGDGFSRETFTEIWSEIQDPWKMIRKIDFCDNRLFHVLTVVVLTLIILAKPILVVAEMTTLPNPEQDCNGIYFNTSGEIIADYGKCVKVPCFRGTALQYCRVQAPYATTENRPNLSGKSTSTALNLKPNQVPVEGYIYYGKGLNEGECGFLILGLLEAHNGLHTCFVGFLESSEEKKEEVKITVSKPPRNAPELKISGIQKEKSAFVEGDNMVATCSVVETRPPANLSMYYGGRQVTYPYQSNVAHGQGDVYDVDQSYSQRITWEDHGRELVCVATHISLNTTLETVAQINVFFKPVEDSVEEEQFGFVLGEVGVIRRTVRANPKPNFFWKVSNADGAMWVKEGTSDNSGHFESPPAVSNGSGIWEASLIINGLQAADVENKYILRAQNEIAESEYSVRISTQERPPEGLTLGTWGIVGIVIAAATVLVIGFVVFLSRWKGKLCFRARAAPASRQGEDKEIDDTETGVGAASEKKNKVKINLSDIFKKKKDKVAADMEELKESNVSTEHDNPAKPTQPTETDHPQDIVYAELDWQPTTAPVIRKDEEKTEYAEIIHSQVDENPPKQN